ncbi:HTH domain-containing protein [Mycoplasmatota bacterium WC44]
MKYSKGISILYIYNRLKSEYSLSRTELSEQLEVDLKTITRYINEINLYCAEMSLNEIVVHSPRFEGYKLLPINEIKIKRGKDD